MEISFKDLGLDESVLDAINAKGFENPTPIQALAIPRLLNGGANVIAKARTGTGKTAAYGLPLVQELRNSAEKPRALILVPTRELALQVAVEMESFKVDTYPRLCAVYGGASIVEQLRTLKRGCEIVIGTPGRVIDHLERGSLQIAEIDYFILDEADEMLNMGFIEDIESIFQKANPNSRVLMFSATMPKQILKIAGDFMGSYDIVAEESSEEPLTLTEQFFWMVREEDKTEALVRLIDTVEDFYGLVFCQTKVNADAVAKELDERHYEAAALHGDIPQNQREKILSRFRAKKTRILVATDVAARGIDIEGISHVVNYAIPYDGATYTHRIGRTGRAGAKGVAVSFIRPNERKRIDYLRRHSRGALKEGKIPSIEQVLAQKQTRIEAGLIAEILQLKNDCAVNKTFEDFARKLIDGFGQEETPADILQLTASLLQVHYGSLLSPSHYRNIKVPRSDCGLPANDNTVRLYIGIGRKDGMTKRKVAQVLSNLVSISEHFVDRIELFERFSLASLPEKAAHEALRLSKKKAGVPHIHIDTKSEPSREKRYGSTKKSPARKKREETRRDSFFHERETKKKHTASTAASYLKK